MYTYTSARVLRIHEHMSESDYACATQYTCMCVRISVWCAHVRVRVRVRVLLHLRVRCVFCVRACLPSFQVKSVRLCMYACARAARADTRTHARTHTYTHMFCMCVCTFTCLFLHYGYVLL